MSGKYDHIDFTPPAGAQAAAKRALEVRAEKPPSERGMTPTGIARARDLANGTTLSPETVRRMLSFFQRHEVDKSGETWSEQGKGWQAWNGWGGDAGYAWARKVVRQMDAADGKNMTTRTLRAEGFAITLSDDAMPAVGHTTWNQIARFGEYRGHPQGAFIFDAACFATLCANFSATENGRVPVDYEHTSEMLPENVAQEGVPAVAWIVALEDRGTAGLWAAFEWVDQQAVEYVRARRYLYVSPAVNFDAIDRASGAEVGPRLTSVALTNHPFLDGMKPLVASAPAAVTASETTHLGLAPAAVHIPAGVEVAPRKELTTMNPEMDAMKAKYDELKARVMKMADMDPEAAEDEALGVIEKRIGDLKKIQEAEAAQMADAVCASGRVPASAKGDVVAMYLSDRARFDRMFPADATKPAAPTGDAKVLLSARVTADTMPAAESVVETDASDPLAESRVIDAMASKLLNDKKAATYSEALTMASRERHDQRVNLALSRLPR
jgi:phage I-like protein